MDSMHFNSVHKFIVQDVKKINHNTKNHQINKSLQNFMYTMLQDQDVTGKESITEYRFQNE